MTKSEECIHCGRVVGEHASLDKRCMANPEVLLSTKFTDAETKMAEVLESIVRMLVRPGTTVRVELKETPAGHVTFKITVPQPEIGKVIGKQGRMARSIRHILGAGAAEMGHRFYLDLSEPARP